MIRAEQAPPTQPARRPILVRLILTLATALAFAWFCGAAMRLDAKITTPPGLFRGMLHGAMMPVVWPTLLAGSDQPIYAERNEGRVYKLGYSLGVNLCGLVFFGWLFFTVTSFIRKPAAPPGSAP